MSSKVLFVDDDEGNLLVCEAHCGQEFEVVTARDAQTALALLERDPSIGVIVSDQRMPGMTGIELLEKVRASYPDVVRLLITAYSDLSAAIDAINLGNVRRYLKKPWAPEELKAELRDALNVHSMSRKLDALGTRLREAERVYSLGIMAASLSHELRNPISWLSGNVEVAKRQTEILEELVASGGERQDLFAHLHKLTECLKDAEDGVNRVVGIVHGISMPLSSRPPSNELVDLEGVLDVTLKLIVGELRGKCSLDREVRDRPLVHGNTTKLSQILLNLLVNAAQALGANPDAQNIIRVTLVADGAYARLDVADNGPGVPEGDWDRIFDPLFTTKMEGGTGLGLAIAREIASELGGSLRVSGDERLGGALFSLRLPRYCEEEVHAAAS